MIISNVSIWLLFALANFLNIGLCYDFSALDNVIDHPRLALTHERVSEIKRMNATDSLFNQVLSNIQKLADESISTKFDTTVAINLGKICSVAAMYQITNDTKYSDWITGELLSLSKLNSWYNTQFLDVATMTFAVTLSYDWVYETMTDDQRLTIEDAIMRNSVEAALGITQYDNWSFHTNNWAQVVHGSMFLAAMTFADKNRTMSERLLNFSLPKISLSLEAYAPDGGWYEGYNYGIYASTYMVLGLAGLESAINYDFGLGDMEGIDKIGAWKTRLFGYDTFHFGFGDADVPITGPGNLWDVGYLEKRYDGAGWLSNMVSRFPVQNLTDFRGLLWYDSESVHNYKPSDSPLFSRDSSTQSAVFRSSWEGNDAWFVGTRGGFNGLSHGLLDSGSFYILKNNVVWATTLNSDSYGLPGYFTGSERYSYYLTSTQGANTLCIANTTQTDLEYNNQVISANSSIISFGETVNEGFFSVVNLTEAYNETSSVLRGVALFDGDHVIIRDEIKADHYVDIVSNWHTTANVTILSGKLARLTSNNETMLVELQQPLNARFHLVSTNPCLNTPNCKQLTNEGIYNLVVKLPKLVKSTTIQLSVHEEDVHPKYFNQKLEKWKNMCSTNCYENNEVVDPVWLRNAERYY